MIAAAVTLFPQPDSPTSERVCPGLREKDTPDVTSTTLRDSSPKPTESPLTSSSGPFS
jgi:hypothetical protein